MSRNRSLATAVIRGRHGGHLCRTGLGELTSGDAYAIWVNDKTPPPLQEQLSRAARQAHGSTAVQAGFA